MAHYWHRNWDGFDKISPQKWFSGHTIWGVFWRNVVIVFPCLLLLVPLLNRKEVHCRRRFSIPFAQEGCHCLHPMSFSHKTSGRSLGEVVIEEITSSVVKNCSAHLLCLGSVKKIQVPYVVAERWNDHWIQLWGCFWSYLCFQEMLTEKFGDLDVLPPSHVSSSWCGEKRTHFAFSHLHLVIVLGIFFPSQSHVPPVCLCVLNVRNQGSRSGLRWSQQSHFCGAFCCQFSSPILKSNGSWRPKLIWGGNVKYH